MSEIRAGGISEPPPDATAERRLVPMRVGAAVVYVEQVGTPPDVEAIDAIHAVAAPSPEQAFNTASEVIRECVRIVGERVEALADKRPQEITVEFSVSFEVKGKASFIPIFVTGEAGAKSGLTVKAVWKRSDGGGG